MMVTKIYTNSGHFGLRILISRKCCRRHYTVWPKVYALLCSTFNTGLALATRIGPATQVSILMFATAL
jgi:hypothetical protein